MKRRDIWRNGEELEEKNEEISARRENRENEEGNERIDKREDD